MNQKKVGNKFQRIANNIIENYIIWISGIILILGIVLICSNNLIEGIDTLLNKVLAENELIRNISLGICGFSITVISLFGVGISNSVLLLNEKSLIDKFIRFMKVSVINSAVVFIITVLLNVKGMLEHGYTDISRYFLWIYFCVVLYSLLAFIRVVTIVFAMFTHNLESINKQDDTKEIEEINGKLEKILQVLERIVEFKEKKKIEEIVNNDQFVRIRKEQENESKKYNKK